MIGRFNSRVVGLDHQGQNGRHNGRAGMYNAVQSVNIYPWQFPEVLDYWDARYGVTSSGERVSAWAPTLKGSHSLDQASGAAQPILLPYSGTNYLWLPGVAGNTASTPDSVALSITGDIDIRWYGALNNWGAGDKMLVTKDDTTANTRSWNFAISTVTPGCLTFGYSNDGSSIVGRIATSSSAVGFAAFSSNWVRATYASATGKVNFYTSSDGATWNPLGTEQTITSGTIFDTTTAVVVGGFASVNFFPCLGKAYRCQIYNGIAGTKVFDPDFTAVAEGATSFTESSSNAATVTINSTGAKPAQIVGSQQMLFDGAHWLEDTFTFNRPYWLLALLKPITWTSNDRIWDGAATNRFLLQQNSVTPNVRLGDGVADGTQITTLTLGSWALIYGGQTGTTATIQQNLDTAVTDTLSGLEMTGVTFGAGAAGITPSNFQTKALAIGSSEITAARRNQLIRAMAAQGGVSL